MLNEFSLCKYQRVYGFSNPDIKFLVGHKLAMILHYKVC